MSKPMFDADALIETFRNATARQGEQLRSAVGQATLAALQGRELTLKNIRGTLKAVSEAASAGVAGNARPSIDPQALLDKAVSGMDDALLKAVQANRVALEQLSAQGADLREKHLQKALDDLDKFEDTMFATLRKTAAGASAPLAGAWNQVIQKAMAGGTQSGTQAASTTETMVQQAAERMQEALRNSRGASMRAAQALAESYGAMVSGVLIGMSDALQPRAGAGQGQGQGQGQEAAAGDAPHASAPGAGGSGKSSTPRRR